MAKQKQLPANYDRQQEYSLAEAAQLLPELSTSKFAGSVDIDIVLNLSEKQRKETLKGSITLPHQFGELKKIIVFAEEAEAKAAEKAGAVAAGLEELMQKVEDNKVEYNIVLATPSVMGKIAKLGKVLGPKGLMPNPANGTITSDMKATISSYQAGKMDFKMSEQGAIRGRVAKVDMTPEQISENILTYIRGVADAAKKFGSQPIRKITLAPTMGAPVKLGVSQLVEQL